MEKIIKKAEVYGYQSLGVSHEASVCDPLFWRALGKACGWERKAHECKCDSREDIWEDEEITYALRFHEINLTEGWDTAVKYLEDLIK